MFTSAYARISSVSLSFLMETPLLAAEVGALRGKGESCTTEKDP